MLFCLQAVEKEVSGSVLWRSSVSSTQWSVTVSQIALTWWMKRTAVRAFAVLILQRAVHIFRILWPRTNGCKNILYRQKGILILCFLFTPSMAPISPFPHLLSSGVHIPRSLLSPCSLQPSLFPMFLLLTSSSFFSYSSTSQATGAEDQLGWTGDSLKSEKKNTYIYTYLISGDEVRLYREIIQLHLCSFHLHGENKRNESSAWVDIGIRQQKAFLSVSTAWGILRKTLGCISDLCLPSPSTFFFQSLCAFHVGYSFSQSELCFSSLQHFVRKMSLSVSTMNVCHVNFGVMDKQIAVTPQMSGTVVSSCHGIFCLKVMFGLMAVVMY